MTENVKSLAKPIEQGYLSKVANEKARQIITAGDIDEQVIERDEWQHSAFTKNLIEGLDTWEADYNKDGCITADELSTYLREHVTEDSDFQQTPQDGRFRNSGGGEFVFFGSGNDISLKKNNSSENTLIKGLIPYRVNSIDITPNIFGVIKNKTRLLGIQFSWTHIYKIRHGINLGYGFLTDNINTTPQFKMDGINVEYRYYISTNVDEERDRYYLFSRINLTKLKYNSVGNNYSSDGYGFIPEIGMGTTMGDLGFGCHLGYSFLDVADEFNIKLLKGFSVRMQFDFNLAGSKYVQPSSTK
jgi:hypothetical protein